MLKYRSYILFYTFPGVEGNNYIETQIGKYSDGAHRGCKCDRYCCRDTSFFLRSLFKVSHIKLGNLDKVPHL